MVPIGGDFAIPNEIWIEFVQAWNAQKECKLEFSLPSTYFEQVKEFELPTASGPMPHVFDGYFSSREKSKQASRQNANALCDLEKLSALSTFLSHPFENKSMKKAWWETLKGDFHDTIAGTGTDRVYRKTMSRYTESEKLQKGIESEIINDLSSLVKGKGPYIFNSVNWTRHEVLEVKGHEHLITSGPLSFQKADLHSHSVVPVSISSDSIENQYLRISIIRQTNELSVYDIEKGFCPIESACNSTNIVDDVGNLWVSRTRGKRYPIHVKTIETEQKSELTAVIRITEENRFVVIHKEVILHAGSKQILFNTQVHFGGKDKRIEMLFPFSFDGNWFTETPFHADSVKGGIYPVQNYAMLKGDSYSIALINRGIPGYQFEHQRGGIILMRSVSMISWSLVIWMLKNARLIINSFRKALVFVRNKLNIVEFPIYPIHNLFLRSFATEGDTLGHGAMNRKNHNRARRRFYKESLAWERGVHTYTYALSLDVKDLAASARAGYELNHPLRIYELTGSGEQDTLRILSEPCPDVIISALRRHKNGCLLRAYEPMGQQVKVLFRFAVPVEKAMVSNGCTDEIKEIKCLNNSFEYVFKSFEVVQIHLLF